MKSNSTQNHKLYKSLTNQSVSSIVSKSLSNSSHPRSGVFHVILIRHAESYNNVIAEQLRIKYGTSPYHATSEQQLNLKISKQQLMHEYETKRMSDPNLSVLGEKQAQLLPIHPHILDTKIYSLVSQSMNRLEILCSPMYRTILTSIPLLEQINNIRSKYNLSIIKAQLYSSICERGGSYKTINIDTNNHTQTNIRTLGKTRSEFEQLYYNTHTADLINTNGWYADYTDLNKQPMQGEELDHEFDQRVNDSIQFIKQKMNKYHNAYSQYKNNIDNNSTNNDINESTLPPDYVILISHADFIDSFLTKMLDISGIPEYTFYSVNTSVSHLEFDSIKPKSISLKLSDQSIVNNKSYMIRVRCTNSKPVDVESHTMPSDESI